MSVRPRVSPDRACSSCGVTGPPHASDADCIAALHVQLGELDGFMESLAEQRARRSPVLSTAATTLAFPPRPRPA
jgi:hypothetical protein